MCGIAGVYAYHDSAPPVDREALLRTREHMFRRGPDGEGLWLSEAREIGFGHRRLAIIDLSPGGAQPMHSADGRYVITFNGEIYNYRALRRELEERGFAFRTQSDTEVLLHLYADRGARMLDALRGMFAFGLWDNAERRLFLARDPFGIKPLYYADDGKTVRFASQVKALLAGGAIDTTTDPAGHAGFYLWGSVPEPYTLYRGIRALPAGHFATADAGGLARPIAWCSISATLAGAARSPARSDRHSAIEALAAMTKSAIAAHTVADVPVGVFLSAGLDSALIASAAMTKAPQSFTLTLGFDEYTGTANDEVPLAEEMARTVEAWHTTLMVSRKDFEEEREKLLAAMDQPSIDGVNTWFIARAAAHMELKVALSGLGGDELFASYPSFSQVPRLVRFCAPLAGFPGLGRGFRRLASPLMSRLTSPKYAGLFEYGATLGSAYLLRRCLFAPWELSRMLDPDLLRTGLAELQSLAQLDATARGIDKPRLAVSALEMSWYMRNQLLRDADWAGMAQSLEIRVPFVDLALLREAAPWLAAYPDITKAEIAAAVNPKLSTAALRRPKTGFSVPVRDWLLAGRGQQKERGLRGWARFIHGNFANQPEPGPDPRVAGENAAATLPEGRHPMPALGARGKNRRVLISTIGPSSGGVNSMTAFVVHTLPKRGLEPVIAHYQPYSLSPDFSVPSFKLLQNTVRHEQGKAYGDCEIHAIGAWLPELEFTHYFATGHWRKLMDSCAAFISVSGNVLAATPFQQTNRPYVAWVATDWKGDRKDRVRNFSGPRKLLDRAINGPIITSLEKRLLSSGKILSLSQYTARMLARAAGRDFRTEVLAMPVDAQLFAPRPALRIPGRIGFTGRIDDPRKNIGLLFDAMAVLARRGEAVTAILVGGAPTAEMLQHADNAGLTGRVNFIPTVPPAELCAQLRTFDVFVLPSHQEGLCISALEAMSCGVPVVSTRCGGPEEFIVTGQTGILVNFDANEMANAIQQILNDRSLHDRLSANARRFVEDRYNSAHAEDVFWNAFDSTFPDFGISSDWNQH